jgi:hypothetical protein
MSECRNAKNTFWCKFRIPGVGSVETLHHRNAEMSECRNAKNTFWCRFRIPGVGSVETLHHRNTEMLECRNAKNTFWCRFRIPGVGVSRYFSTGMSKCRNAEMRNRQSTLWINAWSQLWACEGRSLQVARLHFMIGSWKSQSDSQQIRETRNCEMQFRIRLWSQPVVTSAEDGGRS